MKKVIAQIGVFILKLLGFTPFWLIYLWADLIFLGSYYLIGYRKKTVIQNLKNSFPEKTDQEINEIARKFYLHFADLVVETFKAIQMSEESVRKRFHYKNPQVLDELYDQGKSIALLSGHYGNWEWTLSLPKVIRHQVHVIYRPIQNETFDHYIKSVRSRFGMFMMPARISLRTMLELEKSGQLSATYYLTDQTALKDTDYWMMFLNQETAVFPGAEKVASRFKQAVVFMDIQKVRRGFYEVEFTKLFDDASQTKEYEVTKAHTKFLEEIIRKRPELWLWSHKRWKHTRPEEIALK
ncbi:MAG: lysophospholipid acyltransferase family protein [Bacteroidota bacterium]|uniref:lysophospholipid acyltransferase family protein n=1 Tax=Phenylobacterium sp. TaxID=1871053 RepID=UPI001E0DD94C|nr:lysophospholipid acyltransferase family protein [Phenylobacterium sp.]MBA4410316.1 lauroyl acyltransferase [Odoribacter sp.]MDP3175506.1 lysophospholipid acyltransferase family protein [Phenylobacterium sp.]MDP3644036.1 lysophospholipid acyltransferase family protein [Bacteroidota bacterium]